MQGQPRSQERYERFAQVVDLPLGVLAILWLPVLVVPLVARLPTGLAESFDAVDYFIWALFVVEYLAKLALAPSRRHFVAHHLVDLVVIAVPMLRPLRALRLIRVLRLARVAAVLMNGLRRARLVLTHKGLHFVLLAACLLALGTAALELAFEQGAPGSRSEESSKLVDRPHPLITRRPLLLALP